MHTHVFFNFLCIHFGALKLLNFKKQNFKMNAVPLNFAADI